MVRITVEKPFRWAVDGNRIVQIETGEQGVPERCAIVAVEHLKVARLAGEESVDDRPRNSKKSPAR
jgi:hypothetical protein